MVTKLINISKKSILFRIPIIIFLFITFNIVALWNETMGYLRMIGIGGKNYKSLKKYKNIHNGERCFIIATGPSLTMEDLNAIKNEYTFRYE